MSSKRYLIRAGKHPFTSLSAEASLAIGGSGVFGRNVGNLLFAQSVTKALSAPGAEVVPDSGRSGREPHPSARAARINAEFDHFVLPMADALRPSFVDRLDNLTEIISQLRVPVSIVGIGVKANISGDLDDVPSEVRDASYRFGRAVLANSPSIGVRGETTKEFLLGLGFADDEVDVIGCPSLYLESTPRQVVKKVATLGPSSKIAVNLTPSVAAMTRLLNAHVERYPEMVYLPQEHADLSLLLWGDDDRLPGVDNIPNHLDHPLYSQDRMRFFVDPRTWMEFLAEREFSFGTRLHGTIASLLAGTPAFMLTHNSRVRELAEYHGIPHAPISGESPDLDVAELYERADFTDYNGRRAGLFQHYLDFLELHGVDHIFAHPEEEARWNEQLESTPLPPAVHTLAVTGPAASAQLATRFTWLRQGRVGDDARAALAYRPPFVVKTPPPVQQPKPPAPVKKAPPATPTQKALRRAKKIGSRVGRATLRAVDSTAERVAILQKR